MFNQLVEIVCTSLKSSSLKIGLFWYLTLLFNQSNLVPVLISSKASKIAFRVFSILLENGSEVRFFTIILLGLQFQRKTQKNKLLGRHTLSLIFQDAE